MYHSILGKILVESDRHFWETEVWQFSLGEEKLWKKAEQYEKRRSKDICEARKMVVLK